MTGGKCTSGLSFQSEAVSAVAKLTHPKYGTRRYAAVGDILWNVTIVAPRTPSKAAFTLHNL